MESKKKHNPIKILSYILHITFLLNLVTFGLAYSNKLSITYNILSLLSAAVGEIYCTYLLGKEDK